MIFIVKCISFVMEVLKAFNILLVNDMVPITELYHYIEFMQRKESAPVFDIRFCFQPIFCGIYPVILSENPTRICGTDPN